MPITEIRETLEQGSVIVGEEDDFVIVQKRIDLQSGMRHTMVHVDFMDDSFILPSDATVRGFEFFLSPYPIVYTENPIRNLSFCWVIITKCFCRTYHSSCTTHPDTQIVLRHNLFC